MEQNVFTNLRRQKLTMITKSNAQKYSFVLWDKILDEIKEQVSYFFIFV